MGEQRVMDGVRCEGCGYALDGFGLGQAAVVTLLVLIVLSIVQRMLMVPVRMIWR